jgi:hypothetical protein
MYLLVPATVVLLVIDLRTLSVPRPELTAIRKLCEELIQRKPEEIQEIGFKDIAFKRSDKFTNY